MSDDLEKLPPADEELNSVESEIVKEDLQEGETEAAHTVSSNEYFRKLMTKNFLEYASYVIKDRAIPDVDDGMKPVQRRILWALHKVDEGGTKKAANIVGEVMGKYHPHGDASIQDALVVLANKEYFIKKQGNFGNIISGSPAAASRYIECGLTPLAKDVLYNDDITETVDTYDGRNQEPVLLPVKIPVLLMQGSDGIAVGMATKIMPHNFNEVIKAQIAVLKNEPFELYPDFLQGGIMNVSEYDDGNGKIVIRAKIDIDGRDVVIREIPYTTTTNSLMESIDKAIDKGKIKISNICFGNPKLRSAVSSQKTSRADQRNTLVQISVVCGRMSCHCQSGRRIDLCSCKPRHTKRKYYRIIHHRHPPYLSLCIFLQVP